MKVTCDTADSLIYNLRDIISFSGPEDFFFHRFQLANSFVAHLKVTPKIGTIFSAGKACTGRRWRGKKPSLHCYPENDTWYRSASSHICKIQPIYRLTTFSVKHLKIYRQVLRSNTGICCQSYYYQNSIILLKPDT